MKNESAADAHAILLSGVSKWYGDTRVLHDVDLGVRSGERIVICGPSGSGKSTLIRCINGLEPHQRGRIRIGGTVLGDAPSALNAVRRRVGMVFQQFNLFPHLTILDNCMLAPMRVLGMRADGAREVAQRYLRRVRIEGHAGKYPAQLSGGQQQRAAIARALCMSPDIMLFDEPTSALDPEMVSEVLDTMAELARDGMTMLCVTHEMGFARQVADRVVFMDGGRILEVAPPQTFFAGAGHARSREFLRQIRH